MSLKRLIASSAIAMSCGVGALASTAMSQAATPVLPRVQPAVAGANWLATQFNSSGFIPSSTDPTKPQLSSTINAVIALASAHRHMNVARKGLAYLASNVASYVPENGSDGPGQLALLILAAHALGADPTSFEGTNLVTRLLATEQQSGIDKGMFGTEDQVAGYNAGDYQQGISLAALAAAGITSPSQVGLAEAWLTKQQCPDGGWTSYVSSANPCSGNPASYLGPDTNSTSLAIQGLAAERALTSTEGAHAVSFLKAAEDDDGGWGYEPNAKGAPGSTDPDSTALVLQGLLALGQAPASAGFVKHGTGPIGVLESFQLNAGNGAGSFFFPGSSTPNVLATTQAVPALSGVVFPFSLMVTNSSLPTGRVGSAYSAALGASGSSGPFTWRLIDGTTLPPGLNISSTGAISGNPLSAGTSKIDVEATGPNQTTYPETSSSTWATLTLTIAPPLATIGTLSPSHGPLGGGTTITISGQNFTGATQVTFGATPALHFTVRSSSVIKAVSPPGSGRVDVHVVTPSGTSVTSAADRFRYKG